VTVRCFPSATDPPYSLPLDRDAFRRALQQGHGRAVLHAKQHGVDDRIEDVIHACLHNLSYDAQCEGDRGSWMLRLIDETGAEADVATRLIAGTSRPPHDENSYWDDVQRCRLLRSLASRGHAGAREQLYNMFRKEEHSLDLLACEEIIELDGADGLIHVCEKLGAMLASDSGLTIDDFPSAFYDELCGEGRASRVLDAVCASNQDVARYVAHIAAARSEETKDGHYNVANVRPDPNARSAARRRMSAKSAADVIEWVEATTDDLDAEWPKGAWLMGWGRYVPESNLAAIAERLSTETNPARVVQYLRVFQNRQAPFIDDALLAFADHEQRLVRWVAYRVLSQFDDPRVRELALARLKPGPIVEGALRMLRAVYQPGDHDAIERAIFIPEDRDDLHSLVFDLADVFKRHPLPEARALMLFVYEHSPCGNCRYAAIKTLSLAGSAPSWLREEAACDAKEEIREHFAKAAGED
jgi:hypothetical protein